MPKGLEGSSKMCRVDYSSAAAGHLPHGVGAWPTNDRRVQVVRDSRMPNATSNCWASLATITDYFGRRNNHIQLTITNTKAVISNETSSCHCSPLWIAVLVGFIPRFADFVSILGPWRHVLLPHSSVPRKLEWGQVFVANGEQQRHFFLPQKDTHVQISHAS